MYLTEPGGHGINSRAAHFSETEKLWNIADLAPPKCKGGSPQLPEKPLPTLIQAQICLKFTPPTTSNASPTDTLRKSARHTCPLPIWATSQVVFQHRTTVLA